METLANPRSPRARAVFDYLQRSLDYPFARVVGVSGDETSDVLELDVEPQVPQHPAVDIRNEERIRVRFHLDDERAPQIYARRNDFPLDQVHTNYSASADGLSLCVWEENWNDLRSRLGPQALVERIRDWLSRAARGVLHQDTQPLEPLLPASAHTLIVPPGIPANAWAIVAAQSHAGQWTVVLDEPSAELKPADPGSFAVLTILTESVVHGALRARPVNLEHLSTLIKDLGRNLTSEIRELLLSSENLRNARARKLLLLLAVPKLRASGQEIESYELRAFTPDGTLADLGESLGLTGPDPTRQIAVPLVPQGKSGDLSKIELLYWNVVSRLDRAAARRFAGTKPGPNLELVAIGAGAIGSNVVNGVTKAGLGDWIIIDNDIVLPHNTIRQSQTNDFVGASKAFALAFQTNGTLARGCNASFIRADVLSAQQDATVQIRESLARADLVIDFSASPSVLGHVSDQDYVRRAASFFFNPDATDLVVLAEDDGRTWRLDEIEAQYLLAAAEDSRLTGHLSDARPDFVRYANACQNLTVPVPPWQVHTLAGLAAGQLLRLVERSTPVMNVWRLDIGTGAIAATSFLPAKVSREVVGAWRFTVSHAALSLMSRLRAEALPNESGGILIGSFDLTRRIAHVVAALPAPADSVQAPTYFIRGSTDLKPAVDRLAEASAGFLGYLGEWHSHPDSAVPRPSSDDEAVDRYLAEHLGPTGVPHLVAIRGKHETWFRLGCSGTTLGEARIPDATI